MTFSNNLKHRCTNFFNGFEASNALDGYAVGVIDGQDAAFAELRVWKHADANVCTAAGELLTLNDAGVVSANVPYANSSHIEAQGNAHRLVGSYATASSQTRSATDIWVQTNTTQSLPNDWVGVPGKVAMLPDAHGLSLKQNDHHITTHNDMSLRLAA